jgi:uncharacterized protein DUF4037
VLGGVGGGRMLGVMGGVGVARCYYEDVVGPLLSARWPGLLHGAGRLGSGSDVLGLDDELSRDHDWGLRLTLLVEEDKVDEVSDYLDASLPATYRELPTRFATSWEPVTRQRVQVATAEAFAASRLGLDVSGAMTSLDWLCLTGQAVLEVTGGPVFADSLGAITGIRRKLAWYPDDVWCHVVAADWIRLGDDLPVFGRAGQRGDDLGNRVIGGRMAKTAMHLAFLLARQWPPYAKWAGTMFSRLPIAGDLAPLLTAAVAAESWKQRQDALLAALAVLHQAQRDAGLPTAEGEPTEPNTRRPDFGVRGPVPDLLLNAITDPRLRELPAGVGSLEQWLDSVRVLMNAPDRVQTARAYLSTAARPVS